MHEKQNLDFRMSASILTLLTMVYYYVQSHTDSCYHVEIMLLLGAAVLLENISLFVKADFLPMVSAVCLGVGFGLMLLYALPTFSDLWNHVNFIGGNATAYFIYLASILGAFLLAEIPCFMKREA